MPTAALMALSFLGCAEVGPARIAEVVAIEGDPAAGVAVFDDECRGCHGPEGVGVFLAGPSLQGEAREPGDVVEQVLGGGPGMPAFDGEIPDEEIADVAAYVTETL